MFDQGKSLVVITKLEKEQLAHIESNSEFLWSPSDRRMQYAMVERKWADLPPLLCRARRKRDLVDGSLEPFAIWRATQATNIQGTRPDQLAHVGLGEVRWVWRKITACRVPAEMVLSLCSSDYMVRGVVGNRHSLVCWDDGTQGMEFFVDQAALIPLCVVNGNQVKVCFSIPQQIEWVKGLNHYELEERELDSLEPLSLRTSGESLILSARLSIRKWDLLATAHKPVALWLIAFLGEPTRPQNIAVLGRTRTMPGHRAIEWARFVPRGHPTNFIYLKVAGQKGFQSVPFSRHPNPSKTDQAAESPALPQKNEVLALPAPASNKDILN